jgi:hypothetical protein
LVARFFFFAMGFVLTGGLFSADFVFFADLRRLGVGVLRLGGAPRTSPPMKEGGSLAGKVSSICSSILPFLLPGMCGPSVNPERTVAAGM